MKLLYYGLLLGLTFGHLQSSAPASNQERFEHVVVTINAIGQPTASNSSVDESDLVNLSITPAQEPLCAKSNGYRKIFKAKRFDKTGQGQPLRVNIPSMEEVQQIFQSKQIFNCREPIRTPIAYVPGKGAPFSVRSTAKILTFEIEHIAAKKKHQRFSQTELKQIENIIEEEAKVQPTPELQEKIKGFKGLAIQRYYSERFYSKK